ncbi:MAG: methylated-DNA--[protein]-cysteine S-methyltransferase [Oscillospiraceae bacterium]|nr:methylated-DNA--[protein]-cysteine S-methyltransferase [Oscillospiraceae bacterium]
MELILFNTALGMMGLAEEDGAVIRLYLPGSPAPRIMTHETPLLAEGRRQLEEYLSGSRTGFELPLKPQGTEFQQTVWKALQTIPYGEVRTYGEIASLIGRPKASRAVGMANHNNPIPILIPCHRVAGANKTLTGYGGGLAMKRRLLEIEHAPFLDQLAEEEAVNGN